MKRAGIARTRDRGTARLVPRRPACRSRASRRLVLAPVGSRISHPRQRNDEASSHRRRSSRTPSVRSPWPRARRGSKDAESRSTRPLHRSSGNSPRSHRDRRPEQSHLPGSKVLYQQMPPPSVARRRVHSASRRPTRHLQRPRARRTERPQWPRQVGDSFAMDHLSETTRN